MRFQFRLRTLMIVVTLLAVPLGYVGWQAKIVRERKAAINAILKTGGAFYYHYENSSGSNGLKRSEPSTNSSWREYLFADDFDNPPTVVMFGTAHSIPGEPKLRMRIDGGSLSNLNSLPFLQTVDLRETAVADADLEHLKGLIWLKRLMLNDTGVTHAGVVELRKALPQCQIDEDAYQESKVPGW